MIGTAVAEATGVGPEPKLGTVIADRYVLCERIGAGGMGVVFRAAQPMLSRTVAIKLLHPRFVDDPGFARRFHDEAVAAGRVQHPGSVMVLESGTTADGIAYIVMEDVHGANLGRILAREGLLPLPRVIGIVRQLLAALAEVHASGVVHADVKTDNVLVESTRDGDRVRLIDFGLARLIERPRPAGIDADRAEVSGTPEYMAPEVIRGDAPTPATDIYGAGVILYELLVGRTPFAGGSAAAVMRRHLEEDAVPPSLRQPDRGISAVLDRVAMRALARTPACRFASASAFEAALAGAVSTLALAPRGRTEDSIIVDANRPTLSWAPPPHGHARGSRSSAGGVARDAQLRRAIADALHRGDVAAMSAGYLDLARAFASAHELGRARAELREGIDVITAGGAPPVDCLAPLVDELTALELRG